MSNNKENKMSKKEEDKTLEEHAALVHHVATDQGNGGGYCGHCNTSLGSNPWKYETCPSCNYILDFSEPIKPYSFGGSDF